MRKLLFIFSILGIAGLGGCAATPNAPICSVSNSVPGCSARYYKFKESNLTFHAASRICSNKAEEAARLDYVSGYAGSGRGLFTVHNAYQACIAELGFAPCDEGGEAIPECQ